MNPFMSLGIALILGILFGKLMNKYKIPAVAGYIIAGLIVGKSGLNIVNSNMIEKLSFLSDIALGIIAFNIGSELKISVIKKLGKPIFIIAAYESMGAFILVTLVMLLLRQDIGTALILGAVSSATAPAATVMVLKEYNAKGPLTSTLLGVVAVDDAICLMIYAVASSIAKVFIKHEVVTVYKVLVHPIAEIVLSLLAGCIAGIILTYLIKISKKENEMLPFTTGVIILLIGAALKFHLSPLLSAMTLGVIVANVSSDSRRAFSAIEKFSPPIIAAFFILAGSRLDISLLPHIGLIGLAYLIFRILGKVLGASIGGVVSKAPHSVRKYLGFGLLSQVGVAVGLAIVVSREFPGTQLGSIVITILLATTIITEIIGPIATKNAIIKAKECNV
ncbi:transporter, CPA2 family [Caloranaerobacter azorensis DSM 13643]|uniref:Transporter, CPA2 family n=1 Tax=Caloranaerobacter azorensis DSM 13643 TaxID=1121264 RepID=A0A1M5UHY3_9FIRM|nr:cation:proton antiporter [Caloranaerobacter azorensis]SHH62436.1 transporter, CPA2 family [Caloranaerobacter azorensis DSM 13643]